MGGLDSLMCSNPGDVMCKELGACKCVDDQGNPLSNPTVTSSGVFFFVCIIFFAILIAVYAKWKYDDYKHLFEGDGIFAFGGSSGGSGGGAPSGSSSGFKGGPSTLQMRQQNAGRPTDAEMGVAPLPRRPAPQPTFVQRVSMRFFGSPMTTNMAPPAAQGMAPPAGGMAGRAAPAAPGGFRGGGGGGGGGGFRSNGAAPAPAPGRRAAPGGGLAGRPAPRPAAGASAGGGGLAGRPAPRPGGGLAGRPAPRPAAGGSSSAAGLPPGWKQSKNAEGQIFYYNRKLNKTSWERPT